VFGVEFEQRIASRSPSIPPLLAVGSVVLSEHHVRARQTLDASRLVNRAADAGIRRRKRLGHVPELAPLLLGRRWRGVDRLEPRPSRGEASAPGASDARTSGLHLVISGAQGRRRAPLGSAIGGRERGEYTRARAARKRAPPG